MITCQNITKTYSNGGIPTTVLKNVSLEIKPQAFVSIMGASGSGKSTLMHILGLLDTPTSGSYSFDNRDVSKLSENELADIRLSKIGFVFQSFNLLKRTSVLRNVMLPLVYQGVPEDKRTPSAEEALHEVGLTDKKLWSHHPNQLSGGQMQRVAIARALVNNPQIIFADEPTGNLDSASGQIVMQTFEKLNKEKGRTIILITHDSKIAAHAKRIITIADGAIVNDTL